MLLCQASPCIVRRFGRQLESSLTSTTTAIGRFQNQIYQTRLAFANGYLVANGVRIVKTNMGNIPSRQYNSPDGKTPGISRPITFYWKN